MLSKDSLLNSDDFLFRLVTADIRSRSHPSDAVVARRYCGQLRPTREETRVQTCEATPPRPCAVGRKGGRPRCLEPPRSARRPRAPWGTRAWGLILLLSVRSAEQCALEPWEELTGEPDPPYDTGGGYWRSQSERPVSLRRREKGFLPCPRCQGLLSPCAVPGTAPGVRPRSPGCRTWARPGPSPLSARPGLN